MSELFRNKERDEEDGRRLRALQREQRVNLKAFGMTVGVVIAPFLALLFSIQAALFMLAAGLVFTTVVTWMGSNHVGPVQRGRLRMMAVMNSVLTLVVIGMLVLSLL